MMLTSTAGRSAPVNFREALARGLAPDGGLYQPVSLPAFGASHIESWRGLPLSALAIRLAAELLAGEFPEPVIERLVGEAINFPAPTVEVEPGHFVLELFHGPTLAFKDFGARFLARLFGHLLGETGTRAMILVATSGDTGSAVAQGFFGVANIRVVVLFPSGKVSPFQQAQMATLGGNITAVGVPGTFDDCQRLVKSAFLDSGLASLRLSSANSINIGRLLPQSFYYVASYLEVTRRVGDPVVFSVPSGNLGNLTAGLLAQRMGLPIARFVAASNVNDVLPEFLATGAYRARPATPTLSNAMDVGDPNNFPRLMALHDGDLARVRENVEGVVVDEAATRATIRDTWRRTGYLLDPHGAVGYAAGQRFIARRPGTAQPDCPVVSLATAHPGKFGAAIREELGFEPELPAQHRGWESKRLLDESLPDTAYHSFKEFLLALN